jgi:hypothetical protein
VLKSAERIAKRSFLSRGIQTHALSLPHFVFIVYSKGLIYRRTDSANLVVQNNFIRLPHNHRASVLWLLWEFVIDPYSREITYVPPRVLGVGRLYCIYTWWNGYSE